MKEIKIIKVERERCRKDIDEISTCKKAYLLKFADGKFFYEDVTEFYETIHQDKYMICHDIICDVFYKQIACEHAYTSSSALAGHHNLTIDGSLIFLHGQPHYIADDSELETLLEVY